MMNKQECKIESWPFRLTRQKVNPRGPEKITQSRGSTRCIYTYIYIYIYAQFIMSLHGSTEKYSIITKGQTFYVKHLRESNILYHFIQQKISKFWLMN